MKLLSPPSLDMLIYGCTKFHLRSVTLHCIKNSVEDIVSYQILERENPFEQREYEKKPCYLVHGILISQLHTAQENSFARRSI
jgi:hypothetical protein